MNFRDQISIESNKIIIRNFLHELGIEKIREEIFEGLLADKKYISSKFFYDKKGSDLFEQITELPEYYPTRTEKKILSGLDLSFIQNFDNLNIIEIGSGDYSKISLILKNIPEINTRNLRYIPIDISGSAIEKSGNDLLNLFPEISIEGIIADFMKQLDCIPDYSNRLFCFLGSTIGNFTSEQIDEFMMKMSGILKEGEYFLIGFDNIKDIDVLEKAYNDSQGITAEFNLNILNVVNDLAALKFNTEDFKHISFFNSQENRIEMHIEALKDISIKSEFLLDEISIKKGERIHTENSNKFTQESMNRFAAKANFKVDTIFTDERNWFSIALLRKF